MPAPTTREVDPTGAGDTFAAGFTAATLLGSEPEAAALVACRLAARSVETLGPMEAPVERLWSPRVSHRGSPRAAREAPPR